MQEDVLLAARRKVAPLFKGATMEVDLLVDMIVYGDSGAFLDRIVEPVFSYLAVQVDKLGTQGRDIGARVAYDDCNEALCSKDSVHAVLQHLGLKVDSRRRSLRFDEDPYQTLLEIGEKKVNIMATDGKSNMPIAPAATLGWGWEDARNWWAKFVFGKTFVERRSFFTMYRAFFRIWVFLLLEFQFMAIFLWTTGVDPTAGFFDVNGWALCSLCQTHAACCLLEQVAAAWTQRAVANDIRILGNPFWGRHAKGILDWVIVNAVLWLCFFAQLFDVLGFDLWWYVAGGYAALVILHAILTQRDGYAVSLSYSMGGSCRRCGLIPIAWIFELFGTSSARPPAKQHLAPYHLKTGWMNWFSNFCFWVCVLACKFTFDWFAVFSTMEYSVIALFNRGWLASSSTTTTTNPNDPLAPPVTTTTYSSLDGDIILCIGRCMPAFLVVMNDMQVFYYIVGACFGGAKGLFQLNLGSITNFQDLVVAFHKSSANWWNRGMSKKGIDNLMT